MTLLIATRPAHHDVYPSQQRCTLRASGPRGRLKILRTLLHPFNNLTSLLPFQVPFLNSFADLRIVDFVSEKLFQLKMPANILSANVACLGGVWADSEGVLYGGTT